MIVAAALCPGPPLLMVEVSGADPAAATLRAASLTAVATLVATRPDLVAVVGTADRTALWPSDARPDLSLYGPPGPPVTNPSPLSVGLGALLLEQAGYAGPMLLRTVSSAATVAECRSVAAELLDTAGRVGLLVMADGSARRTLKAPGYLDARAEPYDEAVRDAVSTGELARLHALDPALAQELMASGWAALQVLAACVSSHRPHTTVHYADAPYGVGYLVASLQAS